MPRMIFLGEETEVHPYRLLGVETLVPPGGAAGPAWERLAAKFPTPLLSHDWILAAAETLHPRAPLAVFLRERDGGIAAAAPLVERRRFGEEEVRRESAAAATRLAENMENQIDGIENLLKARGLTQASAAKIMDVSQPRVSDLLRGKVNLFSTDSLIDMLARLGVTVRVGFSTPRSRRVA